MKVKQNDLRWNKYFQTQYNVVSSINAAVYKTGHYFPAMVISPLLQEKNNLIVTNTNSKFVKITVFNSVFESYFSCELLIVQML